MGLTVWTEKALGVQISLFNFLTKSILAILYQTGDSQQIKTYHYWTEQESPMGIAYMPLWINYTNHLG